MRKLTNILFALASLLLLESEVIAKQITLIVTDSESEHYAKALPNLKLPDDLKVSLVTQSQLTKETTKRLVRSSDIVAANMMGEDIRSFIIANADTTKTTVYMIGGRMSAKEIEKNGFINSREIKSYEKYHHPENIKNLILKMANTTWRTNYPCPPPLSLPKQGLYHPDAPEIFKTYDEFYKWHGKRKGIDKRAPWVGLTLYPTYITDSGPRHIDYVIRQLEESGLNVLPAFGDARTLLTQFFMDDKQNGRIGILLSFTMRFDSVRDPIVRQAIDNLNIPIFCLIKLYRNTIAEWRKSTQGMKPFSIAFALTLPELSGLIEPTVIAGKVRETNPLSGQTYFAYKEIPENIAFLVKRVKKWLTLRQKANQDKKIALIFYSHGGKHEIGASYLNVFRSMEEIISQLKKSNYTIPGKLPNEEEIKKLLLGSARNIGQWAPGELDDMILKGKVKLLPIETYKKWFEELPENFKKQVLAQWGSPEKNDAMTRDGNFIIPSVELGNLLILPQPIRGWGSDSVKLAHSKSLPPHHQYIAVYLWLSKIYQADAMIHLGRHGTYEWLPGKQCGLSNECAPVIMVTDIPNAYIYTVDGVGEGMQVKRRGSGVIIDHLTPCVKKSGVYHEYAELLELINDLEKAKEHNSPTIPEKKKQILSKAKTLGVPKQILESIPNDNDHDPIEEIEHYLLEIAGSLMPYGMHSFGRNPTGEALSDTVEVVAENFPEFKSDNIRSRFVQCGPNEINSLLNTLAGGRVASGPGNDPVRNIDALPTGRNFYGVDPNKIPSKAAYELGKKMAQDIIGKHLKKHGGYPDKVALVLWACETIRNEGVNEATTLALMGITPKWTRSGRVDGFNVIPANVLNHPRIDVLVTTSGVYRDQFRNVMTLIDQAVRTAEKQQDIDNFIRKHTEENRQTMLKAGMTTEDANKLSSARIFAPAEASYGTGIAKATFGSGTWSQDDSISDIYMSRMSHVYTSGSDGLPARKLFQDNLKNVDVTVHARSSNIYGVLDNDDCFQYLGGLSMAVRKASGRDPDVMITRSTQPGKATLDPLERYIDRELRSRSFNPKWIEGMKKENYAGAREIADLLENFWGWQVTTPGSVSDEQWRQFYEVYVNDKYDMDLKNFEKNNPWAFQSMQARMLEAIRKGYWKNASESTKRDLAVKYATNAVENGMACCDHTCNNPLLNEMVMNTISIPGLMPPSMVMKFKMTLEKATEKKLEEHAETRSKQITRRENQDARHQKTDSAPGKQKIVKGNKMEEIEQKKPESAPTSSGVKVAVIAMIIAVIGLFLRGLLNQKTEG